MLQMSPGALRMSGPTTLPNCRPQTRLPCRVPVDLSRPCNASNTVCSFHTPHFSALFRRTELCSRDGRMLRTFNFDADCDGGPHEARGMRRSEILEALAAALPPESIRFGAAVASVNADGSGGFQS